MFITEPTGILSRIDVQCSITDGTLKSEHKEEQPGNLRTYFPLCFQHNFHDAILAVHVQFTPVSVKPKDFEITAMDLATEVFI